MFDRPVTPAAETQSPECFECSENTRLIHAEAVEGLRQLPAASVAMAMTSPPYDNLRTYKGICGFNAHLIAAELQRVLMPGGVVVWVVGDQVIDGSESGSSFRHVQAFRNAGFRLHDTMIYDRISPFPDHVRYRQSFEYMFVFSLGAPRVFHPLRDRPNVSTSNRSKTTERQRDGSLKPVQRIIRISEFGVRTNVWKLSTGFRKTAPDTDVHEHPAAFPLRLAVDQIRSWSNPGDHVLDCFGGSGQTAIAAELLGCSCTLIDVASDYLQLAERRLNLFRADRQRYREFCGLAA